MEYRTEGKTIHNVVVAKAAALEIQLSKIK